MSERAQSSHNKPLDNVPRLNIIPNTPSQETQYEGIEKNDTSSNSSEINNWYKDEEAKK